MDLATLRAQLERTFHPPASHGLDAVFQLAIAEEALTFAIADRKIRFLEDGSVRPDATFLFSDMDTAWALLTGRSDAFSAFMAGSFRADGYLMWAFTLMAMFQSESLPETPIE